MARFPARPPEAPRKAGARPWLIWLAWMAAIAVLYLLMVQLLAPAKSTFTASDGGTLHVPRHRDGHFYIDGAVNGVPVQFMVDTGASVVSVSDAVARAAALQGGRRAVFSTASGTREGRIVVADSVALGGFTLHGIEVGTGLAIGNDAQALLGQNVLRHFHVTMDGNAMVLRPR